jgi:hypothetical protein
VAWLCRTRTCDLLVRRLIQVTGLEGSACWCLGQDPADIVMIGSKLFTHCSPGSKRRSSDDHKPACYQPCLVRNRRRSRMHAQLRRAGRMWKIALPSSWDGDWRIRTRSLSSFPVSAWSRDRQMDRFQWTTYTWKPLGTDRTRMTLRNRGTPTGFSAWAAPFMAYVMRRANRKGSGTPQGIARKR